MEAMADLKDVAGITLVPLDVTNIESIRNARETVASALGAGKGLDMLVNNAGVATIMPALDHDISATRQMFEANLFGMMAMVQEFMPLLLLSSDACIVNIGSVAGLIPFAFGSSYNASKAAVHSYSDTLRLGTHLKLLLSIDFLTISSTCRAQASRVRISDHFSSQRVLLTIMQNQGHNCLAWRCQDKYDHAKANTAPRELLLCIN